ncbi:MAG: aspartate/glutamate racemase family protein [Acidobacteria bacterium]|nr:aspartate/glutamate racemase family protein [Acidobacteriota bacterium]
MRTIGVLGGMSWESTVTYYRVINEAVKKRLGGWHSARMVLYSVDFEEIQILQHKDDWPATAAILQAAARRLEAAGAEGLVLATNTMHKVAPEIEAAISIPLLHIADAAARRLGEGGHETIGLLGTRFTMEQDFYAARLRAKFGIRTLIPSANDREIVHRVIYQELCLGRTEDASRQEYQRIIHGLHDRGASAVILGCTEIALLVPPETSSIPLLDTARVHAEYAVEWSLAEGE